MFSIRPFQLAVRDALTIEQHRAFMNYIAESSVFCGWCPFFTVLLGTGCRIGEAVGLRWEDVDMEKRRIDINHKFLSQRQTQLLGRFL